MMINLENTLFVGNPFNIDCQPKIDWCCEKWPHVLQGAGGLTALMHAAGEDQTDVVEASVVI